MKKIYLVLLVVFHILGFQSCTPEVLDETDETDEIEACCGDEGELPPPPPPPPPPPGNGLGD
ncbi:MAG: hypothetical protein AB8B65_21035 [Kordia sp.]|uniref:hypothetical protein n=1 Tax=Kordia sp. TaxID=1965332 RepID=UPI00385EFD1C